MKECTKCHRVLSLENFAKHTQLKSGIRPECKECLKKYHQQYYKQNRERMNSRNTKWQKENRGSVRLIQKRHYAKKVKIGS